MDNKKNSAKQSENVISLYSKIKKDPVKTVQELVTVTNTAMQSRVSAWKRYRRKYRRGLFYLGENTSTLPLYYTNYIFANVETVKANLTKNLPKITVRARGANDDMAADLLTKVLHDTLIRTKLPNVTKAVVLNGLLTSMGVFKIGFDPEASNGDGLVVVESVLPEDFLVDPATSDVQSARWVIHRLRNVPVDKIYAMYGELPELGDNYQPYSESQDNVGIGSGELKNALDVSPTCDVYECWIRVWDENAPNNWYVVTVAGKSVVREGFSVFNHNQCPFVVWFDTFDDGADSLYYKGIGEVEEIEPLQDRADSLDLRIYKNISLLSNRQKYVAAQSGLNANVLDNTPGRVYTVNGDPSKAVYYDVPPALSTDVYAYRNQTELLIQTVSGVFDVTQGRRPVGIVAGRAIENLKESADIRLSEKADTLAQALEQVGELVLHNILQFYDTERLIRLTDTEVGIRVLGDYPPALQSENGEVDEQLLQLREQFKQENGIDLVLSDITFDWDVMASTDTALPSSRADRAQLAADLFRLGAIDRKALLDTVEFPDRHKILERLGEDVTGKNAGQPMAEAGMAGQEGMNEMLMQLAQQLGIDPQQLMQMMQGQGQPQQPQTGNYPPQIAM